MNPGDSTGTTGSRRRLPRRPVWAAGNGADPPTVPADPSTDRATRRRRPGREPSPSPARPADWDDRAPAAARHRRRAVAASGLPELFVEVADTELALPGRRQTDSRIALVTGINRKEVRRIRSADQTVAAPRSFTMNQSASLISRWRTDPQTSDRSGRPRPLPY